MRPEILKLCAFGPYRRELVLDFRILASQPFFLIHGVTGAGKTSIFDAICYALYGEAATEGRTSRMLRNREARPEQDTYVELTFVVRGMRWRIRRNPEYERKAKRGERLVRQAAGVLLTRLKDDGEEQNWKKEGEVRAKIVSLLGFECKEFRQVVLLPQGEFRRFLMADTSARKEIMRVLFNTDIYQKLEEKLKARASGVNRDYEAILQQRELYLQEFGVSDEAAFAERQQAQAKEVAELAGLLSLKAAEKEKTAKELEHGRQLEALFLEDARAGQELVRAERAAAGDYEQLARLTLAERAAALQDVCRQARQAAQKARQRQQLLEKLTAQGRQAKQEMEAAEKDRKQSEAEQPQREARREALVMKRRELQVAEGLRADRQQLKAAHAAFAKAEHERRELQRQGEALQKQLDALQAQLKETATAAADGEAAGLLVQNLQQAQREQELRALAEHHLSEAADKHAKKRAASQEAQERSAKAAEKLRHLRELLHEARAALLAENLADGEPCPVCGSLHHPQLARQIEEVVTDDMLQQQEEAWQGLEACREARQREEQQAASQLAACQAKLDALPAARDKHQLMHDLAAATVRLQAAEKASQRQLELNEALAQGRKQQSEWQQKQADSEKACQEAAAAEAAARARVTDKEAQVPADANPAVLRQQLVQEEEAVGQAEALAKKIQMRAQQTALAHEGLRADWKNAHQEYQQASAEAEAAAHAFMSRLQEASFASVEEYEAALAGPWQDAAYRQTVKAGLEQHDKDLHAARDARQRSQSAIAGQERPQVTVLEQAYRQAEQAWQDIFARHGKAELVGKSFAKRAQELANLVEKSTALMDSYRCITSLSELASGKTGSRVSFQTYVLHSLLDDVMAMANERLLIMSRGQYELHAGERLSGNKQGGLDMEVFDHYSGYARPVATLSGGESFLASLALALGLADVVQAYAGGTRLDTMFIDEGFGTLDEDTLDVALKALFELQKSGRLIGIISHVEELRSRIPARLEVTKTRSGGSTARFVLGAAEE